MMKVVLYEWKKLWKNASVLKIVLFFVSISSIVFWSELSKDKEWVPKYLELHESVDDMKTEDMMGWLKAELEKQSKIENESENYVTYKALSCLQTEIEAFVNYDNYRETIQNRYKDNQSISVFSDSDVGHNKYMEQIARKYKHLHIKASMRLQPYQGVQGILDYYAGDILLIVFLIYLVSVVFIQEQKTGKLSFAHTMDLGGGHLFTAKVILVYGSMILYLFLTFSINFLLMYFMYGSISLSVAVQSVPELFAVPYAWTIGQYLLSYIALKAVAIFLLTAIAILTARWFVSEVAVSAVLAGIIGVSIWAGNVLIGDDIQSIFRFWNLWSVLRGKTFIGNYELIRFDNNFIEVIWGIPVFVITAVVLYLFTGMHKWRERNKRFKERKLKDKKPHTIFYYEMKKMWIYQGGLVFFIVCILIQGMCVNEYRQSLTTCDFYYYQYIDKFGNQITTQTDEKIRLEEQRLQKLEEELMTETNFVKVSKIQQELEWMEGLGKYKYRVEDLKTAKKQEILLKDTQYDLLFNYTDVSRMMVILLCVSFAFFIPAVFQKEKETRMEILQQTNLHGGRKLWNAKIGTIFIYVIPLILVFEGFNYSKIRKTFFLEWQAPAECLPLYWDSNIKTSVFFTFINGVLLQCVVAVVVVILLSACAKRIHNQYAMTGVLLGGLVVPTILFPYSTVKWLRLTHDFFYVFTMQGHFMLAIVGIIVLIDLFIIWKVQGKMIP